MKPIIKSFQFPKNKSYEFIPYFECDLGHLGFGVLLNTLLLDYWAYARLHLHLGPFGVGADFGMKRNNIKKRCSKCLK